jgi:hypothetical protein
LQAKKRWLSKLGAQRIHFSLCSGVFAIRNLLYARPELGAPAVTTRQQHGFYLPLGQSVGKTTYSLLS